MASLHLTTSSISAGDSANACTGSIEAAVAAVTGVPLTAGLSSLPSPVVAPAVPVAPVAGSGGSGIGSGASSRFATSAMALNVSFVGRRGKSRRKRSRQSLPLHEHDDERAQDSPDPTSSSSDRPPTPKRNSTSTRYQRPPSRPEAAFHWRTSSESSSSAGWAPVSENAARKRFGAVK